LPLKNYKYGRADKSLYLQQKKTKKFQANHNADIFSSQITIFAKILESESELRKILRIARR